MSKRDVCRVLVLGSHRARLERVFAILHDMPPPAGPTEVHFLAAVAAFDAYKDEAGNLVKYLLKIDYFPTLQDGTVDEKPQTLLPFFDEVPPLSHPDSDDNETSNSDSDEFYGISTAVIGSGLDVTEHGAKIQGFLDALSPNQRVTVVAPFPAAGFATMAEEFAAFKQLDSHGKAEAIQNRTMGPGKVAQFAMDTALQLIQAREARKAQKLAEKEAAEKEQQAQSTAISSPTVHFVDPDKKRYACRKCRSILFGEADLEDPPHVQAQHKFGFRARKGGTETICQSLFLGDVPSWVTADLSMNEGKIECYKCHAKVGHWNWAGAQCSCGTWVCPAIQVPSSRVDEVPPLGAHVHAVPPGTIENPVAAT